MGENLDVQVTDVLTQHSFSVALSNERCDDNDPSSCFQDPVVLQEIPSALFVWQCRSMKFCSILRIVLLLLLNSLFARNKTDLVPLSFAGLLQQASGLRWFLLLLFFLQLDHALIGLAAVEEFSSEDSAHEMVSVKAR